VGGVIVVGMLMVNAPKTIHYLVVRQAWQRRS
jgi:hypothetical protein